jgi:hypothetical protein
MTDSAPVIGFVVSGLSGAIMGALLTWILI